ncbi:MAG: YggT family protein [Chloroflexi bacterium]|nr:YggT family protein [Chloroflexota bacterium]
MRMYCLVIEADNMGRPWWYDSYWQDRRQPKRRLRFPRRRAWIWTALVLLSLLLAAARSDFRFAFVPMLLGFVFYSCRILSGVVLVRAVLSWFSVSRYNPLVGLLDDLSEPLLAPLRRVIPALGAFDFTPLIAIVILYLIPLVFNALLG